MVDQEYQAHSAVYYTHGRGESDNLESGVKAILKLGPDGIREQDPLYVIISEPETNQFLRNIQKRVLMFRGNNQNE
jgi:hypothetical protein